MNENKYEYSFFMIKPCGIEHKKEILKELNQVLDVVSTTEVTLDKEMLEKIYRGENNIFKKINISYLHDKKVIMGVVGGIESKERLMEVCGQSFKPEECDKDSIRFKYSIKEPINVKGYEYYINAIHRSQPEDAEEDVEMYFKYFKKAPSLEIGE